MRVLLIFICFPFCFSSQILNVDREIKRDTSKNHAITFDLSFSGAKIKGDLITLKGKLEYDYFFRNNYFIMCLGTIKSLVNGKDIIKEFLRRGGLRCEVLISGEIKVGDKIKIL